MKKAIIINRVSSKKQVQDGNGLHTQDQRCRKYAEENGLEVAKSFYDEGVSGAILDRPAILEALEYIRLNKNITFTVIFDDISRIARNVEVHWALKKSFESLGAKIDSPNFKFEDSPSGVYIETIMAGASQLHRDQNKLQVNQKMRSRLEQGYWAFANHIPGYRMIPHISGGKSLTKAEPEASVIKEIREGFANNRFITQTDALKFLRENKGKLQQKSGISLNTINRILLDNFCIYSGDIRYLLWDIKRRKGNHEGLTSQEIQDKINDKLRSKKKSITSRDNFKFPLRGMIYCNVCKKKMTGSTSTGKLGTRYPHYTCNNSKCSAKPKNIKKDLMENQYIEMLDSLSPDKAIINIVKDMSKDIWKKASDNHAKLTRSLERRIKTIQNESNECVNLILKSNSETIKSKYEQKIEDNEIILIDLHKQIIPNSILDYNEALEEVVGFIGTPSKYWNKGDLEAKVLVHNLIFTDSLYYDSSNKFGTPKIALPFAIKGMMKKGNSCLVEMAGVEPASE